MVPTVKWVWLGWGGALDPDIIKCAEDNWSKNYTLFFIISKSAYSFGLNNVLFVALQVIAIDHPEVLIDNPVLLNYLFKIIVW